jgi:aryl-alcohol dehydrogenase-like predicted oxidoreductase
MRYKMLGKTGIRVSRLCLGAMSFGKWGNADHDDCVRLIHQALEGGINFIDTSDVYSFGESEEILAKALKGRRDDVIIASKFNHPMTPGHATGGGSRRWIMRAVEDSLRRLQTDYIDVYLQHALDPQTDLDETLGALSDLVRQGKLRVIGSSNYPVEAIVECQWLAERRCAVRMMCNQAPYSMLVRFNERDVLPVCEKYGMGVMVWSPLAGGWLGGGIARNKDRPKIAAFRDPGRYDLDAPVNQAKLDATERLTALADAAGLPLSHMAMAFVAEHPAVTSSIIGISSERHLIDALASADLSLDKAVLDAIDEIVQPGCNTNESDRGWVPLSLSPETRRGRAGPDHQEWRPAGD